MGHYDPPPVPIPGKKTRGNIARNALAQIAVVRVPRLRHPSIRDHCRRMRRRERRSRPLYVHSLYERHKETISRITLEQRLHLRHLAGTSSDFLNNVHERPAQRRWNRWMRRVNSEAFRARKRICSVGERNVSACETYGEGESSPMRGERGLITFWESHAPMCIARRIGDGLRLIQTTWRSLMWAKISAHARFSS